MENYTLFTSVAAPLNRANVDTDQIIPKQFLLAVDRKGFGRHLFHDHRWLDAEETKENPDFVLNRPAYAAPAFSSRSRISATARAASTPRGRFSTTGSAA